MPDWTTILNGGILAIAAWTLFEVHSLRVAVESRAVEQSELKRRVEKLERRVGL